jgi:hypothetical protein
MHTNAFEAYFYEHGSPFLPDTIYSNRSCMGRR